MAAKVIRLVITDAHERMADGRAIPLIDKVLMALTFLGVAVVVAWPKGRSVPVTVVTVYKLGQQLWNHRDWWLGPMEGGTRWEGTANPTTTTES